MQKGFTLIEMLIVCAVLAILLAVAAVNFQNYRNTLELRQAQQLLVQEFNRARSDSRRLSQDQMVTWNNHQLIIGTRTVNFDDAIELVKIKGSNDLIYTAPYGRVKATDYLFEVRRGDLRREVYVYGVTGKIKAIGF